MFFCSIFFSLCAFYFALCALCNKRHLTWVPGVALCQLWNILAAAAAILTCLLSWLERPNSSNSFAPTTGKFGRNSLLRTIFKFLRLLSSTGRNTQWWPQHQPLVSREFFFFTNAFEYFLKDSLRDWVLHSEIIATKITFSWGIRNSLQEIPSAGHAAEN